jgi:methanethiol S-methyltransferase
MIWLILSVLLWGALHSWLASVKVKEMARQVFGKPGMRFYRLTYNALAGLSFLLILLVSTRLPDQTVYRVPLPWSLLMLLGEGLAVIALLAGLAQSRPMEFLGIHQLGSPTEKPGHLNTNGLYRAVRHPLYTAGLVFIWLIPIMTRNVLAINIGLTIYVIAGAILEERKLIQEFGKEYVDYMTVTPMFIPFLKGNKSPRKSS